MNDVVSTFPLFRLPINALLNTLRSMTHLEIFGISTLSKKTKNLVESLKLTVESISVCVTDVFAVHLELTNNVRLSFELYQVLENEPLRELETPSDVYVLYAENPWKPWANLMSVKQLLDHLQFIFRTSINTLYFGAGCERFSFASIQENVNGSQGICFINGNEEQNKRVLRFFQPAELHLLEAALDNGHIPRYILIENGDRINVLRVQIALDDLLVSNVRSLFLICDILSMKVLNRFLKLWTKGSSPRLEYLFLRCRNADFQEEELLRGLKCQHVPFTGKRFFKVCGRKEPKKIMGGDIYCDIRRWDGTLATILVHMQGDSVYFELFVWHDHCFGNS